MSQLFHTRTITLTPTECLQKHFNYPHNSFPARLPAFPRNPMDTAIRSGDMAAVAAYLCGEGGPTANVRADPNVCDLNSVAPIHLAAAFGRNGIAQLLLDAKVVRL